MIRLARQRNITNTSSFDVKDNGQVSGSQREKVVEQPGLPRVCSFIKIHTFVLKYFCVCLKTDVSYSSVPQSSIVDQNDASQ